MGNMLNKIVKGLTGNDQLADVFIKKLEKAKRDGLLAPKKADVMIADIKKAREIARKEAKKEQEKEQ